jgi:nitrogen-specific signal transduction histidine kinase/ActR/RegA family two-component response regulator
MMVGEQLVMAEAGKNGRTEDSEAPSPELTPEYLATLVHEIRNPLAPIRNAAELLRSLCIDPRQLQAVDVIERQVVNLTHRLDDALEAAHSRRSLFSLSRRTVDIHEIVEPALRAIRPHVDQLRQNLLVSLPQQPVQMNCDPIRLSQVVQTLLDNATRHTPEGGAIALRIGTTHNQLTIEVSDNGAGISAERLPALFNMFAQSTQSGGLSSQPSGYNLAISRNIVEMHGGTISAESAGVGRGSRFAVHLPLQSPMPTARMSDQNRHVNPRRILVIDDHADSAQSLAQVLARAGHSVITAMTGELALSLAEEFKPEAAVIDIGLPDIDGFEVAQRMRKSPMTQRSLLIAISGFSLKQFRDLESYSVFRHYLLKPTSPYTIMYIIESTLDHAEHA